jgi:hypothetical protein
MQSLADIVYNVKNINGSQNTTVFIIIYYLRATCFDSFESSSGPPMNRPKTIYFIVHSGIP